MHGMGAVEKPQDFMGTFKRLLDYLGGYKFAIALVIFFALCSTVFAIVGPKILGMATTKLFEGIMSKIAGTSAGVDFGAIARILLWLAGLYLLSTLFQLTQGLIMTGVSNRISYRLRRDIDAKIHRLPFSYYDSVTVGDSFPITNVWMRSTRASTRASPDHHRSGDAGGHPRDDAFDKLADDAHRPGDAAASLVVVAFTSEGRRSILLTNGNNWAVNSPPKKTIAATIS